MCTPVKLYERSRISSDPAGVFHISPYPAGASYENFVWGGGRNDKRRELCFSQWIAASVQTIVVWLKLYSAKLSIRIVNVVIRAMILPLHARACLFRGHKSSHVPIFTRLMGFVRTGPRGVFRESMDRIRAEVPERLSMSAMDLIRCRKDPWIHCNLAWKVSGLSWNRVLNTFN